MSVTPLLDRKLLFVTGKGGTGKTTMAAALARLAAGQGKRVLLCEIDATGDIGAPFRREQIGFDPYEVEPGLFLMAMDTERALQEYLRLNLKVPFVFKMGPFARALDFVATAAPGVREILTVGKLCWDVKREFYDLIVVDAPASGHVVSQLESPDAIAELVNVGPLVGQTAWMKDILRDETRTGAVVVTTPQELPVSETIELVANLKTKSRTPIAAIVVNRVLPELFVRDEIETFAVIDENTARFVDAAKVPADFENVVDAARLATRLRRTQVTHIEELRPVAGSGIPLVYVPQSFTSSDAAGVVEEAQHALQAELDL
jgi:anion-transporting  ArsA/GET3 family ATPase